MSNSYEIVINSSSKTSLKSRFIELWSFRELIAMFARQAISVQYKQTIIGGLWVVLQPLISSAIFAVLFGVFAKFPSGELPYYLYVFAGMIVWQFISKSMADGSNSLVSQSNMLSKIYFPRAIPAITPSLSGLIDFTLVFLILLVMGFFSGYIPQWTIVFVPLIMMIAAMGAAGVALIFAPINAIYRDVGIALPFFIQILMFVSPIMYSSEIVPEQYRFWYELNPVATLVGLIRWSVFGTDFPHFIAVGVFVCIACCVFGLGLKTTARLEQTLIDRL